MGGQELSAIFALCLLGCFYALSLRTPRHRSGTPLAALESASVITSDAHLTLLCPPADLRTLVSM